MVRSLLAAGFLAILPLLG